jgi:hypothetical protein
MGWKHTKPPKNCSHKYNHFAINFFGNVWTSHVGYIYIYIFIYLKHIWLALDLIYFYLFFNSTNIENFEHMEYINDKIIPITKFEILNIYFKTKVVDRILGQFFLWCMTLIYIN